MYEMTEFDEIELTVAHSAFLDFTAGTEMHKNMQWAYPVIFQQCFQQFKCKFFLGIQGNLLIDGWHNRNSPDLIAGNFIQFLIIHK